MKRPTTAIGPASPPRLAVFLLRRVALPQDRDYLLSDVREEFDRMAAERGRHAAARWYWRQALTSAIPSVRQRSAGAAPNLRALFRLGSLADDGRHAWRWTQRNRWLAATMVATLAISMSAGVAAMTILHAVLLHPLPFAEPERLFRLWSTAPDQPPGVKAVSLQDLDDWRRDTRGFSAISGWTAVELTLTGRGEPRRVPAIRAGLDLDRALMIRAAAGRLFERATSGAAAIRRRFSRTGSGAASLAAIPAQWAARSHSTTSPTSSSACCPSWRSPTRRHVMKSGCRSWNGRARRGRRRARLAG